MVHRFLVIVLQLELLEATSAKDRPEYLDQLEHLPKGSDMLERTYKAMWKRILQQDDEDVLLARAILTWVCCAAISQDVTTLRHALAATRPGLTHINNDDLIEQDLITSVCLGLVIINEMTSQVRFVHYTAQEFFRSFLQEEIPDAHLHIATYCIRYLSVENFDTDVAET